MLQPLPIEKRYVDPSKPQFDAITSRQQVTLFMAGQGSGKTQVGGVISGMLIQAYPKIHGFIGANTYLQLSDSTLSRIKKVWKEYFNWTEWSKDNPTGDYIEDVQPPKHFDITDHYFKTYRGKICFRWGTVVFTGSLDNYKAHEGKEFGWAILDETKDTPEEAVKEVITGRLREPGMYIDKDGNLVDTVTDKNGEFNKPFNPLYILTSPAKVQWINEWFSLDEFAKEILETIYSGETYFIKDVGNKRAILSSVYHNERNLPSTYIPNQKANLNSSQQKMLIYGDPFSSSGAEFYKCFDRAKHVRDLNKITWIDDKGVEHGFANASGRPYNKDLALHVSFDFNVNPYITCIIWQIVIVNKGLPTEMKFAYQIDEICLENPRNTTLDVCREIVRRYNNHEAGMFVYGDPTGKQEDTRSEKGHNDYVIIARALDKFKAQARVLPIAPPVVMRGNWINTTFEKDYDSLSIVIHEKCVKSIADYTYLKEAADGEKLKEKVKNPDTGITYEKYGHTSDAGDYFLCVAFANEFNKYKRGGTSPNTPTTGKSVPSRNSY